MKERAVLVTGGAGFIGSNLVDLLMESGYVVYVLDDLSSGTLDNLERWTDDPHFRFIRGDVSRPLGESVTPAALSGGPHIGWIFHLAARVDVTSSFEHPLEDARVNYTGTMNVLDHALKNGVEKVIFSSSAAVYGDTDEMPISEETPQNPLSPYGLHKLASEKLMDIYRRQWGLDTLVFRFFNVYGPRQDPSNPYSGVISRFMEKASSSQPLMIYGDGLQTRDFIFVEDVAQALLRGAMSRHSGTINLGTGSETSIIRLADLIIEMSGREIPKVHMQERKGEIRRSMADMSRFAGLFRETEMTPMREGLKRTFEWYKRRQ